MTRLAHILIISLILAVWWIGAVTVARWMFG